MDLTWNNNNNYNYSFQIEAGAIKLFPPTARNVAASSTKMCGQLKGVPLDRTGQPVKEPHSVIRNEEYIKFTLILRLTDLAIQFWAQLFKAQLS